MSSTRVGSNAMANTSTNDDDALMSKEHKSTLREYRDQLVDNMYPDDLLNSLQSTRVLSHRDSSRIKEKGSAEAMNECLLDILIRKPDRAYTEFISALRDSDQNHVANIIDKNRETTPKNKRDGRKNVGDGDDGEPTPGTSRKRKVGEIGIRLKTDRLDFDEDEDEDEDAEVETPRRKMTRRLAEEREREKEQLKEELDIKLLSIIKKELRNLDSIVGSGISETSMAKRKVVMETLKELQKYRREITSVDYGSVLFRMVCPTLSALLDLRHLCTSGRLAALVEKIFTIDDFRERKLRKVHVSVTFDPMEFDLCKEELKDADEIFTTLNTNDQENQLPDSKYRINTHSSPSSLQAGDRWHSSSTAADELCRLKYISLGSPPHHQSADDPSLPHIIAQEALQGLTTAAQLKLSSPSPSRKGRGDRFLRITPGYPRGRSPLRRPPRRPDGRIERPARKTLSLSPLPNHQRVQEIAKASRSQPGRLAEKGDMTQVYFHTYPSKLVSSLRQ